MRGGWLAIIASGAAAAAVGQSLSSGKAVLHVRAPAYAEGPSWKDGSLFFCGGGLLRVTPDRQVRRHLDLSPAGTYALADGRLLICDNRHRALLQLSPDGKVGVIADSYGGRPLRRLNDLTVDLAGNIYWTDPKSGDPKKPDGNVFRVTPSGRVDRIASGRYFPNGIEVDPAGRYLYVVEYSSHKVLRCPVPSPGRPLGPAEVFYKLRSGGDGCAFDEQGNLWLTDFGVGEIAVVSPAGRLLRTVKIPAKQVTNLAFGGKGRDVLFVTTGTPNAVFRLPAGVRGFRLHPGAKEYRIRRWLPVRAGKG